MKKYALVHTTNKEIMEKFGRKSGYSLSSMKQTRIDTPLRIDNSIQGIVSLLTDDDGGFQIRPTDINGRKDTQIYITNSNIYIFEEL